MTETTTPTTGPSGLVERLYQTIHNFEPRYNREPGKPCKLGDRMALNGDDRIGLIHAILALSEFAALTPQPGEAAALAGADWFAGDVDCDGNELITVRKDEWNTICEQREKFMWQVRDTCARAEKAEAALAALSRQEPDAGVVERRDGPISEHLLSDLERTPQAAAERVLAFLNWKGEGFGSIGPSLNYGDLRILAEATTAVEPGESEVERASYPHEYGPSQVGHGEAQCKWCFGTNRENAVIAPNHCDARRIAALVPADPARPKHELCHKEGCSLANIPLLLASCACGLPADPAKGET